MFDRRQCNCPKCGGTNSINCDQLAEEWACRVCGWQSGQRAVANVPATPEPGWPHQRAWTHKD
ncbi:MAG: hypothetical protein HQ475_11920 [SAR202 cluster bacterium]|nr:hypothetical protein [SAR202 cluster bacterium]